MVAGTRGVIAIVCLRERPIMANKIMNEEAWPEGGNEMRNGVDAKKKTTCWVG